MRFSLRQGSREILVFDRMRLVRFDSIEEAAEFLLQYARQPENLQALRVALAGDPQYAFAAQGDDAMVIVRAADLLVAGRLHVVDDPLGQMPWSWAFPPTPSMPVEYKSAEGEETEALANETETEESESENEDVKPEPVIPPEYPLLAEREGEAVKDSTEHYNLRLDLLRYVGLGSVPEAEVPDEARSAAYSMAYRVLDASKGLTGKVLALASLEDVRVTETEVGIETRAVAESVKLPLTRTVDSFAATLAPLGLQGEVSIRETEIGKATIDVANVMRDPLSAVASTFKDRMLPLAAKAETLKGDSEVAYEAMNLAESMKQPLTSVVKAFAESLRNMVDLSGEPDASELAAMFQMLGVEQEEMLLKAAKGTGESLNQLFKLDEKPAKKKEEPKILEFSLEDVNEQPMRYERYCVEFPDGRKTYGMLNAEGRETLKDVGEGPFMLSFPSVVSPWKVHSGQEPPMTVHTVVSGESLSKIAKNYSVNSWVQIYEHPANATFRAKRPNPNLIYPGDLIFIPNQPASVGEIRSGAGNRCRIIDPLKS